MSHNVDDLSRAGYGRDHLQDLSSTALRDMAAQLACYPEAGFSGVTAAMQRTLALAEALDLWEAHAGATTELLRRVWEAAEGIPRGDYGPERLRDELADLVRPLATVTAPAQRDAGTLPWGVIANDADKPSYAVECPECGDVLGPWHESVDPDALWLAAAAAQCHRDSHHRDVPARPPTKLLRQCSALVPRGGGVRCDLSADHAGEHAWGLGPWTRPGPHNNPPTTEGTAHV